MAYLGKGRREDLATELNLEFDKSLTIATFKDVIFGSENYDEELTKNIHSTIVEDRKARGKSKKNKMKNYALKSKKKNYALKNEKKNYALKNKKKNYALKNEKKNYALKNKSLLPTEVSHIIAREPDDKANSYEHVKDLLLKRFKLTPEKFRQLFVTHQKAPERTWIDFYHGLNTSTDG
ncbi:uncharacterized protein TNCV_1795801 [Trichonephila clavipes]|nr:uncharacterized protein TNCV_1795801 [Trichonephila clavipes]